MRFEESFVEGVVTLCPIRRGGERKIGQREKRGKPDASHEGFPWQYLSHEDDDPCHKNPQGEKADVTERLNLRFKAEKERLLILLGLSHDKAVACNE